MTVHSPENQDQSRVPQRYTAARQRIFIILMPLQKKNKEKRVY